MRIQGDSQPSGYPLAPASSRAIAPRGNASAPPQYNRSRMAVYVAEQKQVDVLQGVSARGQRAIAAYTQNDVFEQRMQYTQLLGVDVFA